MALIYSDGFDCNNSSLALSHRYEWVIKFKSPFPTEDIGVHIVHISRVIITYTLESLSSLTQIIHDPQVTYEKWIKNKQKREGTH